MKGQFSDIQPGWLNIARHGQAAASGNGGYALITIKVMVLRNEPVFWYQANVEKIQPMALGNLTITEPLMALLAASALDGDSG